MHREHKSEAGTLGALEHSFNFQFLKIFEISEIFDFLNLDRTKQPLPKKGINEIIITIG